ncbi:hypothetical protein [Christiangramia sp. SM2212]|uniref:Uncharacterized protein n=1 Tax=Christiangramia sediminicola TaxID=3073267 RepID=A0ABU1EKU5_9FLAO|nr:hypothetical protein [Christiangramia sp. SM2212]MDR5589015.1 hypothetical protein [Christiangramia sp. SM2212]
MKEHLPFYSNEELAESDSEIKGKRIYPCRVQTISDSVVVSFGFEEKPVYGDVFLATISFFHTISVIWRNALEAGFTIRGAADWGPIFWNDKEIIGPSFINAYSLEQNQSKSSRVIISSSLNRNLAKVFMEVKTFWNDEILKILRKDNDGFLIINPHYLYENDDEEEKERLIMRLKDLRSKANHINKEKYNPLLTALNSEKFSLLSEDLGNY